MSISATARLTYDFQSPQNGWNYRLYIIPPGVDYASLGGAVDTALPSDALVIDDIRLTGNFDSDIPLGVPDTPTLTLTWDLGALWRVGDTNPNARDLIEVLLNPIGSNMNLVVIPGGSPGYDGQSYRRLTIALYTDAGLGGTCVVPVFCGCPRPTSPADLVPDAANGRALFTQEYFHVFRVAAEAIVPYAIGTRIQNDGWTEMPMTGGGRWAWDLLYVNAVSGIAWGAAEGQDIDDHDKPIFLKLRDCFNSIEHLFGDAFAALTRQVRPSSAQTASVAQQSWVKFTCQTSTIPDGTTRTETPFDIIGFYKQNYLTNGATGSALTAEDIYLIAFAYNAVTDGDDYLNGDMTYGGTGAEHPWEGGFFTYNEGDNGIERFDTLYDFLRDVCESTFTKVIVELREGDIVDPDPLEQLQMIVRWIPPLGTSGLAISLDRDDLWASTASGSTQLRLGAPEMGAEAVITDSGAGDANAIEQDTPITQNVTLSDARRSIRMVLHNNPLIEEDPSRYENFELLDLDDMDGTNSAYDGQIIVRSGFGTSRLYYMGTSLAWSDGTQPVRVHSTVSIGDGLNSFVEGDILTFEELNFLPHTTAYLEPFLDRLLDMQTLSGLPRTVARRYARTFTGARQTRASVVVPLTAIGVNDLGRRVTLADGAATFFHESVNAGLNGLLASTYYVTGIDVDPIAGTSNVTLLGIDPSFPRS
jgi:hypothetical protein